MTGSSTPSSPHRTVRASPLRAQKCAASSRPSRFGLRGGRPENRRRRLRCGRRLLCPPPRALRAVQVRGLPALDGPGASTRSAVAGGDGIQDLDCGAGEVRIGEADGTVRTTRGRSTAGGRANGPWVSRIIRLRARGSRPRQPVSARDVREPSKTTDSGRKRQHWSVAAKSGENHE